MCRLWFYLSSDLMLGALGPATKTPFLSITLVFSLSLFITLILFCAQRSWFVSLFLGA